MKKFITLTLSIVFFAATSFANNGEVSHSSTDNFADSYNGVSSVNWVNTGKYDKAIFTENGVKNEVFYTTQGDLVGIFKNVAFDKLPKSGLQTITTKYTYPAYELADCISFENTDGDVTYFISMNTDTEKLILEISQYGAVTVFSKQKK